MTTITATATRLCQVCSGPSTEDQGLVYEIGGYVHAACSTRSYQLVTEVSFPDEQELGSVPPAPVPASATTGPLLCDDCSDLHDPSDLCSTCQEACNEWEQGRCIEPDWDALYERYQMARHYLLVA